MSDLPSREATAYQWLRVDRLLSPTVEPIVGAYADGMLMTRQEFIDTLDVKASVALLREKLGYFDFEDPPSEEAVIEWLPELIEAALGGDTENSCDCARCNPDQNRMIVCSECGNKRCPKATDHILECTNSNEPGQSGSSWEDYQVPTLGEGT